MEVWPHNCEKGENQAYITSISLGEAFEFLCIQLCKVDKLKQHAMKGLRDKVPSGYPCRASLVNLSLVSLIWGQVDGRCCRRSIA